MVDISYTSEFSFLSFSSGIFLKLLDVAGAKYLEKAPFDISSSSAILSHVMLSFSFAADSCSLWDTCMDSFIMFEVSFLDMLISLFIPISVSSFSYLVV